MKTVEITIFVVLAVLCVFGDFATWDPMRCLAALLMLLFGKMIGPSSIGIEEDA